MNVNIKHQNSFLFHTLRLYSLFPIHYNPIKDLLILEYLTLVVETLRIFTAYGRKLSLRNDLRENTQLVRRVIHFWNWSYRNWITLLYKVTCLVNSLALGYDYVVALNHELGKVPWFFGIFSFLLLRTFAQECKVLSVGDLINPKVNKLFGLLLVCL